MPKSKQSGKPLVRKSDTPIPSETEYLTSLITTPDKYDPKFLLAMASQVDNPDGFCCFYQLMHGKHMPDQARPWVEQMYKDHKEGKGTVVEAFRGSTKTTTMVTFAAFRIGHEPQKANLIIQLSDDRAKENASKVADIIENHPYWKVVFPHVVPDTTKAWGANGYEVKRIDMVYEEWRRINSERQDPTFLGSGYTGGIIGMHPDGFLLIDDILDEGNTSSDRMLAGVMKIVTDTIFPMTVMGTWSLFIGTPWTKNDVLAYVKATGEFGICRTPVYALDENGKDEFEGQKVTLAWPEWFSTEELRKRKALNGSIGFARMYLLDLEAAANQVFKWHSYPHSMIDTAHWQMVGGADPAGSHDPMINKEGKLDEFALAYVAKIPGGGAVLVDGVVGHFSQAEAEGFIVRAQNGLFPMNWQTCAIEMDGRGMEFFQVVYRNPTMKLLPVKTGGKSKHVRWETNLGAWLESGRIKISDEETPFLNKTRQQLNDYPLTKHDDCISALWVVSQAIPDVLVAPNVDENSPWARMGREKEPNPFTEVGNW